MTNRNRILATLGVLVLCSVFGASQALAVNIGGVVLTLELSPQPVGDVTVSVHSGGTGSAPTGVDGSWSFNYTGTTDPVLKITASAAKSTVETYTTFPLTLLADGYQTEPYLYAISAVPAASMVSVPDGSCAVIGFALKYTSLGFPADQDFLSGVLVTPTPTAYIGADGVTPCVPPACIKTTTSGAWVGIHVPAEAPTAYGGTISVGGSSCADAPDPIVLSGGDVTCIADTANVTGLIHPELP